MADLEIVHRRSFVWLWWLVGVLALAGLVWFAASTMDDEPADLQTNPDAPAPVQQATPPT